MERVLHYFNYLIFVHLCFFIHSNVHAQADPDQNAQAGNTLFTFALEGSQSPATDYITGRNDLVTTEWPLVWVNRCADLYGDGSCPNNRIYKGNAYNPMYIRNGREVRPQFTTIKKADACTRMNAALSLSIQDSYIQTLASTFNVATVRPLDIPQATITDMVHGGVTRSFLIDTCVLSDRPASRPTGLVFDYEVHDRRSPKELAFLVTRLRLHSRNTTIVWYTNSLFREATRRNNAMTGVGLDAILDSVDYIAPVVWSGATPGRSESELSTRTRTHSPVDDFLGSLALIGEAKIIPFVSLHDVTVSEVATMRSHLSDPAFGVWRNFQSWEDNLPLINCLAGLGC